MELGEEVGFDALWATEHHVSDDDFWPAGLERLSAAAALTDLDLVTSLLILPLHNALNVAERAALLDDMSEGRLTIGVGLGYVQEEFEGFGVSMDDRAGRLVEGVQVLDRYLTTDGDEEFSYEGNFYDIQDWRPLTRPHQEPRPPLWMGGWGDQSLKRSVRLGDAWVPGWTADNDQIATRQEKLERFAADAGKRWSDMSKPLMQECVIAESHDEAMRLGRQHQYLAYSKEYGTDEWSHPFITKDEITDYESLAENRFLHGTPDEVIAQIEQTLEKVEADEIACRFHYPGMDHEMVMEQIELFGEEVIPSFS